MNTASVLTAAERTDSLPLVSVIMIFFDGARFIAEAIDSVIAQTWPHWELLLVDDGSRDASRQIAERYRQSMPERIHILEHHGHVNRGMSASRNLGLAAARGGYLTFLDADDVYLPARLERHVELLEQHPDAGVVQGCVEYWRSWPEDRAEQRPDSPELPPPVRLRVPVRPPELLLLMLEAHGATAPGICSLTMRRSVAQAIGGSAEDFRAHYEDQVLYAKIYLATGVVVIADRLARYRQHAESLTGRDAVAKDVPHRWYAGRTAFLAWLETWLQARKIEDKLVWQSLHNAQKALRRGLLSRLWRQPLAALRRVAELILPGPLSARLIDWRGRRKLAASARHTARTHARISRLLASGDDDSGAGHGDGRAT